jgi:ATP-dependent exoDNAse (exonuclease V) beta subunit
LVAACEGDVVTQSSVFDPQSLLLPDEEARRRVAADLDTTFLVEAGAGTGKTSVLLQRLLALVRSGRAPLERIAAITFTEKAAVELRMRLRAEIETLLAGALPKTEWQVLHDARRQLEHAQISTVHAFCAALLRERPVEARVDPDFTVLDEFATHLLRQKIWREWLAQEMDRSPAVLKQALRSEVTLAHLESLRDFVVDHRDCLHLLPEPLETHRFALPTTLQRCVAELSILRTACVNETDRALAQIATLTALLPVDDDEQHWERLVARNLPLSIKAGAKTNWNPASALDQVRMLFAQIEEAHSTARVAQSHNLSVGLVGWLDGYLRAYQEKKQECSSLDFLDLLLLTRDLLKNNLEVRRSFQRRFHSLLVDECQDTDPLQAEIIFFLAEREPRAREWTAVTLLPGKLFLVGDPQQSIYRFRRADLEIYNQARTLIAQQGEVLSLSANFRTCAPALTWINETFTREFASVGEAQPPYRPLIAARPERTDREIIVLPVAGGGGQASRDEIRKVEAETVARFITQTVARGETDVWGGRAVDFRDIAILFRTYQAMEAYEDALQQTGIPYRVLGGRRYASRQEVEELRALLRALESPSDTTAIVATLRSSLFGFSDEDLAAFVSGGGKLDYMQAAISELLPVAEFFSAAFSLLRKLHARCAQVSPATLLSEIYNQTHLVPFFALRPQGVQRVANLLKLIDTARALAGQELWTLAAFNRFLVQMEAAAEEAESPIIEEHEPALRLLTIHRAKGLEFSIVILADAVYSRRHLSPVGIVDRLGGNLELRIGSRALTCTTQGWQKAETREETREVAEERRLWYVAATRVRDHLVIPVTVSTEGESLSGQWTFPGETLPRLFATGEGENRGVFVYRNVVSTTVEQDMPILPHETDFAVIPTDAATLRAYQTWEAERHAVRARGGQPAALTTVTVLTEANTQEPPVSRREGTRERSARYAGLRLGRAVHAALRKQGSRTNALREGGLWNSAEQEEAKRLLESAMTSPVIVRAQGAREHFSELPFVLHYEERLLEGVIDLAFVEEEKWIVVDFKTDAVAEVEAIEARASRYWPQLSLYALALEHLSGRSVKELILLFVRSQRELHRPWNDQQRAAARMLLT